MRICTQKVGEQLGCKADSDKQAQLCKGYIVYIHKGYKE
jgi:hypothetical protein